MALWPQLKETSLLACTTGLSTGVPAVGLAMPGPDGQLMHVVASALIQKMWLQLLGPATLDLDLRPTKRQTPHGQLASLVGGPLTDRVKNLIHFVRR